jgi:EPSP synthase (3-phosphoshikimate 1-carboxyvinyltransferase)
MAQSTMAKGLEPRIYVSGSNLSRSRAQRVPITSSLRFAKIFNSTSLRCRNNGGSASSRHVVVRASVAAAPEKPSTVPEIVLQPIKEISGTINLPGSKSLSNRTLLLAALSEVSCLCQIRIMWVNMGTLCGNCMRISTSSPCYTLICFFTTMSKPLLNLHRVNFINRNIYLKFLRKGITKVRMSLSLREQLL